MYDDQDLPPVGSLTGLDGMFAKTNVIVLILFGFCCGYIALILGIVGVVACTDPRAKKNALIVTLISVLTSLASTVAWLTGALPGR